jgi:glycosyltransferase involved in cell wall biosynthesis
VPKILIIAFHYPPVAGSSGVQRAVSFARYLPQSGWEPTILTIDPRAYESRSSDMGTGSHRVVRAWGFDAARQLAVKGKYLLRLATPDRWATWHPAAVLAGLHIIRRERPACILSTYPIATAHKIGATLARLSGLPWLADFRDPMAQEGYPAHPALWRAYKDIEESAVRRAAMVTFVTHGAMRTYADRYPEAAGKFALLQNGYDEASFAAAERVTDRAAPLTPGATTVLHSGIVYPSERDPTELFRALGRGLREGGLDPRRLRFRFRASAHDDHLRRLADEHGATPFIELAPSIPYQEALAEMLRADALLVLQASNCNDQVPAKLYEYFRAGRPIIALTDPQGDTARLLDQNQHRLIARLDSEAEISQLLPRAIAAVANWPSATAPSESVSRYSREGCVRTLAGLLDSIAPSRSTTRQTGEIRT